MPFLDPKWPICPERIFLVKTIIITFICLMALFIVQIFLQRIQSYEDASFLHPPPQKKYIYIYIFFPWKIINIILIYLLAHFIVSLCKILKKSSSRPKVMRMRNFGAENGPFPHIFKKPVNEPCLFHLCLSSCQKSKSYINLLVKY